jgi:hypothetical protein
MNKFFMHKPHTCLIAITLMFPNRYIDVNDLAIF